MITYRLEMIENKDSKLLNKTALRIALLCICVFSHSPAWSSPKTNDSTQKVQVNQRSLDANEKGIEAVKARDYVLAEKQFREALILDPSNLTAVFNLGSMYITNKKLDAATKLLEEYANKNVEDAGIYVRLGDALFANKKPQEALPRYLKAYKLEPTFGGLAEKVGISYTILQDIPHAEEFYLKAVELSPDNPALLSSLSGLFLANKKPEKAISTAKRSLQVKAQSDTYLTLGAAYQMVGDYKNALISFEKARDLGSKDESLTERIAELQKEVG